jgi:HK97 gp10 family phage protein
MIQVEIDTKTIDGVRKWLLERPKEMIEQLNRAVKFSVIDVERQTKTNSPVDTGLLRTSVHHITRELEGEVIAGVKYAIYQEYGTRYFRGRYFMTNAVNSLKTKINEYFRKALEKVANK